MTIEDGMIINNADLFQMLDVQDLVELTLPLPLFLEKDPCLSTAYYDFNHIQFVDQFRNLILENLHSILQDEAIANLYISNIIDFIIKEAKVTLNTVYTPPFHTKHPLLLQITEYIHNNINQKLSTKNVSKAFYISQSYISILFSNILNMTFKHYTTSLKIALSLFDLIQGNQSIYAVALKYQFTNVSTYSKHFKYYIQIPPKKYIYNFRKETYNKSKQIEIDASKMMPYLTQIQKSTSRVDYITKTINVSSLTFDDTFNEPHTLIQLERLDDLLHLDTMISEQKDMPIFPKVNISILDTHIIHLNALKLQQVLSTIHQLINSNYHITLRVTPEILMHPSNTILSKLLTEFKNNLTHITLQLDFSYNEAKHLPKLINHIKQDYPQIKIGIILDTMIINIDEIVQIRHFMSLLDADFYYINLNLISLAELISQKGLNIRQSLDLKALIVWFLHSIGSDHAKKLIFNHITHAAIKSFYPCAKQDTHIALTEFLIEFNHLIGGFGYPYYSDDDDCIMLFNQYQSAMPVVHIYGLLLPYYNQQITILPYAIVTKNKTHYHILLFNNHSESTLSVHINHHFIKSFPILSSLINNDYGLINNLIPQNINQVHLDQSLLKQINKTNYPRLKLTMHYFKDPLIFKLTKSTLLNIMISIN